MYTSKISGFKLGSLILVFAIALMSFNKTRTVSAHSQDTLPAQSGLPEEARAPLFDITAISAGGGHTYALTISGV